MKFSPESESIPRDTIPQLEIFFERENIYGFFQDLPFSKKLDDFLPKDHQTHRFSFSPRKQSEIYTTLQQEPPQDAPAPLHITGVLSPASEKLPQHLEIIINDSNDSRRPLFHTVIDSSGEVYPLNDVRSPTVEPTLQTILELTLQISDLPRRDEHEVRRLFRQHAFCTTDTARLFPVWLHAAQQTPLSSIEASVVNEHVLEQSDAIDRRIRIGQKDIELQGHSKIRLDIEHALRRLDTEHDIVTHLELIYTSEPQANTTAHDTSHAEKRVHDTLISPEFCLSEAVFFDGTTRKTVYKKELDAYDGDLLREFKALVEIATTAEAQP